MGHMNVLTLLVPKKDVDTITSGDTLRQAVSKLNFHHYADIPVLSEQGHYLYSISAGDMLFYMAEKELTLRESENVSIDVVPVHRSARALPFTATVKEIGQVLLEQNYVPLVDERGIFMGIITRKRFATNAMKYIED